MWTFENSLSRHLSEKGRRSRAGTPITRSHASLATGENEPVGRGQLGPSSPIRRACQRRGCERVQNSAGADACPERRVAPRLDDDQDTKDEHQPRQPDEWWQERRRREREEQDADRDEPRRAERG